MKYSNFYFPSHATFLLKYSWFTMLISALQQSDSVIHIYVYIYIVCGSIYIHILLFNLFFFFATLCSKWCYFPNQDLNLHPLKRKSGVLTPGMPGKSHIYVCMCIYIYIYSLWFNIGYWIYFSVLCSRNLSIHCIYSSLYLLTPISYSISPPILSALEVISLFLCPWMCFCLIHMFICVLS